MLEGGIKVVDRVQLQDMDREVRPPPSLGEDPLTFDYLTLKPYRGTSLIRPPPPVGPNARDLW